MLFQQRPLYKTPEDVLAKARRDLERLEGDPNAETVFNFFVTAYHVMDYVKLTDVSPQAEIDAMYADPDFELCQAIANCSKHLKLTRPGSEPVQAMAVIGAGIGASPIGGGPIGGGAFMGWSLAFKGSTVHILEAARRVVDRWEALLRTYYTP